MLEAFGGLVPHQLECVATFEECLALSGQSFELHRLDLCAVLFALQPPLRLFIVVEFAFDTRCGAMEEVDRRPEHFPP